jgi:mannose-6-phosphate isomerase
MLCTEQPNIINCRQIVSEFNCIHIHLKSYGNVKPLVARTEKRPWGSFERFTLNEKCTVKLVNLDGDKRLSLQYHNNRSEFWKVIKGPVEVQLDNDTKTLQTGEALTIPKKAIHRLIGAGTDAIILEISMGEFDENDIVRLEDDYQRP